FGGRRSFWAGLLGLSPSPTGGGITASDPTAHSGTKGAGLAYASQRDTPCAARPARAEEESPLRCVRKMPHLSAPRPPPLLPFPPGAPLPRFPPTPLGETPASLPPWPWPACPTTPSCPRRCSRCPACSSSPSAPGGDSRSSSASSH